MKPVSDPLGLGVDLAIEPDLGEVQGFVSGRACLAADLAHRLQTPRGTLFYDASFGYDVRRLLLLRLDTVALAVAAGDIRAELLRDERITAATVQITPPATQTGPLLIVCDLSTATGPFVLVLTVSAVAGVLAEVQ
jgi:hypothetical protein